MHRGQLSSKEAEEFRRELRRKSPLKALAAMVPVVGAGIVGGIILVGGLYFLRPTRFVILAVGTTALVAGGATLMGLQKVFGELDG